MHTAVKRMPLSIETYPRSARPSSHVRFNSSTALVVAGVQKSGTTLLSNLIADMLKLPAKRRKEPHIFERCWPTHRCRMGALNRTSSSGMYVDVTPLYFDSLNALLMLPRVFSGVKVIVTFRDPISRAFSAWDQNRRSGAEVRSFDIAIAQELEGLTRQCGVGMARLPEVVGAAWRVSGDASIAQVQLERTGLQRSCASWSSMCWLRESWTLEKMSAHDRKVCRRYVVRGLYAHKLAAWRAVFQDRLLTFRMEDVIEQPEHAKQLVRSLLGLVPAGQTGNFRLADQKANQSCWHACGAKKADPDKAISTATKSALAYFYSADLATLRKIEPTLRW